MAAAVATIIVIIFIVFVMMLVMMFVFVLVGVAAAAGLGLFLMDGLGGVLLVLVGEPVDHPAAEEGREEGGDRADDGEGKPHQRVGGGDGVHARLRGGNQEAGAGPVGGALLAEAHRGGDDSARAEG